MICCDSCDDWYHPKCVGKTKKEAQQIEIYICPNCKEMGDELFDENKVGTEADPPPPKGPPPPKRKRGNGTSKVSKPKPASNKPKLESKVIYKEDLPESDGPPEEDEDDEMFDPTKEGFYSAAVGGGAASGRLKKKKRVAQSTSSSAVCKLITCSKRARAGNAFCSDDHEAEHAQAAFFAMLGGGGGGGAAEAEAEAAGDGEPSPPKPRKQKQKQKQQQQQQQQQKLAPASDDAAAAAAASHKASGPRQTSGGGGSKKILNKFREGVLLKMAQAVKRCSPKLEQATIDAKVKEIEKAMYKLFNKQTGTPYKRKYVTEASMTQPLNSRTLMGCTDSP